MRGSFAFSICALLVGSMPQSRPSRAELSKQLSKELSKEVVPESANRGNPRYVRSQLLVKRGGAKQAEAIAAGLAWLANHQSRSGRWSCHDFADRCPEEKPCSGKGLASNDIGSTGLALLALLGDGNTHKLGDYRQEIKKGALWLIAHMGKTGLIGPPGSKTTMYNHAIATTALVELAGLSESKILRTHAQRAVDFILRARNPYKAWRYFPRGGDNDSSVTGFAVMALTSARTFGFKVDKKALHYGLAWYDEVTDPATGSVGYRKTGDTLDKGTGQMQRLPALSAEALLSLGLYCRLFLGQSPAKEPIMRAAADRLLNYTPEWTEDRSVDLWCWYFGTLSCFQMGSQYWNGWKRQLEHSLLRNQTQQGHASGSWKPIGVWGSSGGRIASTALSVMCLQAYYSHAKLIRK